MSKTERKSSEFTRMHTILIKHNYFLLDGGYIATILTCLQTYPKVRVISNFINVLSNIDC